MEPYCFLEDNDHWKASKNAGKRFFSNEDEFSKTSVYFVGAIVIGMDEQNACAHYLLIEAETYSCSMFSFGAHLRFLDNASKE